MKKNNSFKSAVIKKIFYFCSREKNGVKSIVCICNYLIINKIKRYEKIQFNH